MIVQPVITWGDSMRTRTRLRRQFTSLPGPRLTSMPSDSVKWVHSSGSIHSIYLICIYVFIIFFIEKKKDHYVYLENFGNLLTSYCCKRWKFWILLKLQKFWILMWWWYYVYIMFDLYLNKYYWYIPVLVLWYYQRYKRHLNNIQKNSLLFSDCWLADIYSVWYYDSQSYEWKTFK